jgi:hypothetical protein
MMPSELEYLDSACEMTVLPQPKAPGMAHVPPSTDGKSASSTLHRAAEAAGSHASERSGVCTEHAVAHVSSLGVSFARGAGAGCLRGVCRFTGEARTGSYVAHR